MREMNGVFTRCVHAGKRNNDVNGALHDPIYLTSNYRLPTDGTPIDWAGINTNIYARNGNINQYVLQDKLTAIEEGAEDCVVFASGVAALHGVFLSVLKAGDHVVCSKVCYSAVNILFREILPESMNLSVTMVDSTDPDEVRAAVRPGTRLIHIETPGNPTNGISDIALIAGIAKENGCLLSVDSTFASPLYQHPLALGADYSIHSMTKYINGHGDALGGCVMGKKDKIEQLKRIAMVNYGGILSPFNAYLIGRGLMTLPLRMKQHCENGIKVARFLEGHEKVRFVSYPGLESHPQHELAARQMGGFSGMISFDIAGGDEAHQRFLDKLTLVTHAVSLGDGESLIAYIPATDPKVKYYPGQFKTGFYRFSVGLEDADDIIADLANALNSIG